MCLTCQWTPQKWKSPPCTCLLALPLPFRKYMQHADLKICPLWHHQGPCYCSQGDGNTSRQVFVWFCSVFSETTLLPPRVCLLHAVGASAVAVNRGLKVMLFSGDLKSFLLLKESGDAKQRGNECNMGPLNWSSDSLCRWLLVYNRIQYFKAPLSPRKHEKYISDSGHYYNKKWPLHCTSALNSEQRARSVNPLLICCKAPKKSFFCWNNLYQKLQFVF